MAQWAIQGTQVQTITKDMFVQETTKVMFGQPFHLQLPHDQLLHLLLDQHDRLGQQDHLEQHNDPALHQRLLPCHALLPHYQHDHLERLNDHALQQRLLLCHAIGTKLYCVLDIMNFDNLRNILPLYLPIILFVLFYKL